MKRKIVELKEYDVITTNREASRGIGRVYLDKDSFKELERLILTTTETDDSYANDFFTIGSLRNVGKIIRAKNYVGVLQLPSTVQLQILPKLNSKNQEDIKKTFLKMLKTLKEFPSKTFNEANLTTEKLPIFEVFIRMYIREVQLLVKKGLKSTYYNTEDNIKFFKGKINFSQHLKYNTVHRERFFVRYDEYGLNTPENRLIKTALSLLLRESHSSDNVKDIRILLIYFEAVDKSKSITNDLSRLKKSRNLKIYESAIKWTKIFLENKSFTTFVGDPHARSLLFPMERLFESYVGRHLSRVISYSDWEISLQDRGHYLFENHFALRPDIVLRHERSGRVIILDTKWKLLKDRNTNYGISQADMYQMYAYAKKYRTNEIWLIYPLHDDFIPREKLSFKSDDGVQVNVFCIDCHEIEWSLSHFMKDAEM